MVICICICICMYMSMYMYVYICICMYMSMYMYDMVFEYILNNICMTGVLSTVSGYRSLLQEEDNELKVLGVSRLLETVSVHWTDIANDINTIYLLLQDPSFPDRPLVAMLLCKLYFYLNQYEEALGYALQASHYFDVRQKDQVTEILVNKCVEKYITHCRTATPSDPHFKAIVDHVITSHLQTGDWRLVLGIAMDTMDIVLFERVLGLGEFHEMVAYVQGSLHSLDVVFRRVLLDRLMERMPEGEVSVGQALALLSLLHAKNDYEGAARLIYEGVRKGQLESAYTLALEVSEMHGFNKKVLASLPIEAQYEQERRALRSILEGTFAADIHNAFLKAHAHTDPHYLALLKKIEYKNSIAHGSAIFSLSMLQSYTQNDEFLAIKENQEWAGKSSHWSKFTSIASLGLIFKNNKQKDVFRKFLPESNTLDAVNYYPNGGALYGLGLLFTGTAREDIVEYLIGVTTNPTHNQNQVVMHGACLGLGLTAFASANDTIAERLKEILNMGSSVLGQASALALGLTFAGTNHQAILSDLIATAQDTQHQKIIRSVSIAIGLICLQSPSPQFLNNLQSNPTLKLAVPFYLACAYFKTSNAGVVRKLLNLTNDISNEVKRTALIALGFVMYQDPELVSMVKMLLYSYNPNVRYGCIMALAIGAKDSKEAIDLIWPSFTDTIDYVRQGAFISVAIMLQISNDPKLSEFRKVVEEVMSKPHGQIIGKMGAILSVGLLDIAGRNMTVALTTRSGVPNIEAIAGFLVFTQFWNWFPYLNFIGLALKPSAFIGVTAKLKIPTKFQLKSNCKLSLFDYPPKVVKEEKKKDDRKENAKELSVTSKIKCKADLKKKEFQMDVENVPASIVKKPSLISTTKRDFQVEIAPKKEEKIIQKKEEQSFSILNNPTRVSQKQKKFITFIDDRYEPILQSRKIGICFLKDHTPHLPDQYLNEKREALEKIVEEKDEDRMTPPQEFIFEANREEASKGGDSKGEDSKGGNDDEKDKLLPQ